MISNLIFARPFNPTPYATLAPSILGTIKVGETVQVTSAWNGASALGYQWYRNDAVIVGATSPSYTLVEDDRGKQIKVLIIAEDSAGRTGSSFSHAYDVYTDYYISELDGDFENDGSSEDAPITVAKLLSLTLSDRTRLFFKSGESFYLGEFTCNGEKFGVHAYGEGDRPKIWGSEDISTEDWTDEGSGIYSMSSVDAPLWVFRDNVASKWAQSQWIQSTAIVANNIVRGNPAILNTITNIVGSKFRIIEYQWIMSNEFTVIGYDSGTGNITIDGNLGDFGTVTAGLWFALYDDLEFVTENDEWFYDAANEKLYYKAAAHPSTLNIRACWKNSGITLTNSIGSTVSGVHFTQYNDVGLSSAAGESSSLFVENCLFSDIKGTGLRLVESNNTIVRNCEAWRCGITGIAVNNGTDTLVEDCYVNGVGMDSNYPLPYTGRGGGIGLIHRGTRCITRYNEVENTAYNGMTTTGINCLIEKNIVHGILRRLRDGAAFYVSGPAATPTVSSNYGNVFRNNWVYGISPTSDDGFTTEASVGIYVDNRSENITIQSNVIETPRFGVLANWNSRNSRIQNNIFVGCQWDCVRFREDTDPVDSPLFTQNNGNIMTGNVMAVRSADQICVEAESFNGITTFNPFSSGGSADENTFIQPFATNIARYRPTNSGTPTDYTLAGWRTKMGQDANSISRTNFLTFVDAATALNQVKVAFNATADPVTVNIGAGHLDKDGNAITEIELEAYTGAVYTVDS